MFGTATTGTSHDIQAIPGLWRDAQGEAEALSSRGMHHAALRSAMLKDRKIVLMDRLGWDLQSPDSLLRLALPAAARLPPVAGDVTRALLWLNWTLLCWRLLVRALFTLRVHGLSQAILTPPRALVGNFINAMAALRALSRYAQAVRTGRRLAWDKTIHRFPGFSP